MKFSIKDFFSKCDLISRKMRILSHLLKKSLMKKFIFVQCMRFLAFCVRYCQVVQKIFEYSHSYSNTLLQSCDEWFKKNI